jgi:hypothetical protein
MVILIILLIILIILIFLLIRYHLFTKHILKNFKSCNVIVAGKKGTGKDLLFQYVIKKRKKEKYYSNIEYGYNYTNVKLKDISCEPNNYENIVNDKIVKTEPHFEEKADFYISDIGIFLPSYMDSTLYKKFPSMPIFYALSRHLYDSNIHCNTQNIERGWKALREQADFYCITRGTIKVFGFLITKITTYDKYQSAKEDIRPIKARLLNKYSKAEVDIYKGTHGTIKEGYIIQRVKRIKYDTRAFKNILLTSNAQS